MKTPIASDKAGKKACINKSTIVVKDAITIMKIGIRIESGINFLKRLIMISLITRTKVIAQPIPKPFAKEVVTANEEHNPIIITRSGFSLIKPFVKMFKYFFMVLSL